MEISKRDWEIFKKNLPLWQERYMDCLNREYCEILQGNENPSEKFWKLEERINSDKKSAGVIVRMSRSNMINILVSLLNDNIIEQDDLNEFSDEIKETIRLTLYYASI